MAASKVFTSTDLMRELAPYVRELPSFSVVNRETKVASAISVLHRYQEFSSESTTGVPTRLSSAVYAPLLSEIRRVGTPERWSPAKKEEMVARRFFASLADEMAVSHIEFPTPAELHVYDLESLDALMLGFQIREKDTIFTKRTLATVAGQIQTSLDVHLHQAFHDISNEENLGLIPVSKEDLIAVIGEESLNQIIAQNLPEKLPYPETFCFTKVPASVLGGGADDVRERLRIVLKIAYLNASLALCDVVEANLPKGGDSKEVLAEKKKNLRQLALTHNAVFILSTFRNKLDLSGKGLHALSPEVKKNSFAVLDLRDNRLHSVPSVSASTKYLNLSGNPISRFHSCKHMTQLEGLSLGRVGLTAVPKEMKDMSSLRVLDLRDNQITSLPADLASLNCLLVGSNPLVYIDPHVIERFMSAPILTEIPAKACQWSAADHATPIEGIDIDVRTFLEETLYVPQSNLGSLYNQFATGKYNVDEIKRLLDSLPPETVSAICLKACALQKKSGIEGLELMRAQALEDLPSLALAVRAYVIDLFDSIPDTDKEAIFVRLAAMSMRSVSVDPSWVRAHAKDVVARLADAIVCVESVPISRPVMDDQIKLFESFLACKEKLHYLQSHKPKVTDSPWKQLGYVKEKVKFALAWNTLCDQKKELKGYLAARGRTMPSLLNSEYDDIEFVTGVYCPEALHLLYYQQALLERCVQPIFADNYLGYDFGVEWHYEAISAQGRMLQHMVKGPFDSTLFYECLDAMTPVQKTLLGERVYREKHPLLPLPEPEVIAKWAELHLLDDMVVIGVALQRSVLEQFEKLSEERKSEIYARICAESGVALTAAPTNVRRCLSRLSDLMA